MGVISCIRKPIQLVKPLFNKLDYVSYRVKKNNIDNKLNIYIDYYLKVDSAGVFHILDIDNSGIERNIIATDTMFRLPDTIIIKLNRIFNGSHKLNFYKAGSDFGYSTYEHEYISYETKKGIKDDMIVFEGVSDTSLVNTLDKFWHLPHAMLRQQQQHKIYKNDSLINDIWACQERQHVYLDWNHH